MLRSALSPMVRAAVALNMPSATVKIRNTMMKPWLPLVRITCKKEENSAGLHHRLPIR